MSKYTDQDIVDENGNKILASSLDANYIYHQSWEQKTSTAIQMEIETKRV